MGLTRLSAEPIRCVVIADVRLYCEGLAAVIPREQLVVVGSADSRAGVAAVVQTHQPDVALVDVAMVEALEIMRQLRADPPAVQVIAFGVGDDVSTIVQCAEAGAVAYVGTSASVEDLVAAVVGAVAGELQCTPRVAGELIRRAGEWSRTAPDAANSHEGPVLTSRQRQVLAMLRQSLSNKEIAVALNISEATVKNHVHQLLDKLHVTSRAKAAACLPRPHRMSLRSRLTLPPSEARANRS
jgi:two-component system, NarL family, nitrate/nitrite response regulator NarL